MESQVITHVYKNYIREMLANSLFDEARISLQDFLRRDKDNHEIYALLGECAFYENKYTEAEGHLLQALNRAPMNDDVLVSLGTVSYKLGKKKEANNYFRKAYEINPENPDLQANYNTIKANQNNQLNVRLCSRGVLYTTPVCNLRCEFCYYTFVSNETKKHPDIRELKRQIDIFWHNYKLEAVDLTGVGEPTTYPHIEELVEYCSKIGLKPTIITNGQLPGVINSLIDKGHIDDFLVSVHDTGKNYNILVKSSKGWDNLSKTLNLLREKGQKFRTNTCVTKNNQERLKEVIDVVDHYGSRIHNFIIFNPHENTDWAKKTNVSFQAKYSEIAPILKETIDYAGSKGLWCNVRYIPLCLMTGYEGHVCNFHQWIYDPYEWEECSGRGIPKFQSEEQYIEFIKHKTSVNHFKTECSKCINKYICDGIYPQYIRMFGDEEFVPTEGEYIKHPMWYRGKFAEAYSR